MSREMQPDKSGRTSHRFSSPTTSGRQFESASCLGLESRFTLRFISIRRWIVALCGALDLHPD